MYSQSIGNNDSSLSDPRSTTSLVLRTADRLLLRLRGLLQLVLVVGQLLVELLVGELVEVVILLDRARRAPALVHAVVEAVVAHALAAAILEPAPRGGAERAAVLLALVLGDALADVDHGAVDRDEVVDGALGERLLGGVCEVGRGGHVGLLGGDHHARRDVHGEGEGVPPVVPTVAVAGGVELGVTADVADDEGVPQLGDGVEVEDHALLGHVGQVRLGAELEAGAALGEEVAEAELAALAAGARLAGDDLALAGLEEGALGHDGGAHGLVAGLRPAGEGGQEHRERGGEERQRGPHGLAAVSPRCDLSRGRKVDIVLLSLLAMRCRYHILG